MHHETTNPEWTYSNFCCDFHCRIITKLFSEWFVSEAKWKMAMILAWPLTRFKPLDTVKCNDRRQNQRVLKTEATVWKSSFHFTHLIKIGNECSECSLGHYYGQPHVYIVYMKEKTWKQPVRMGFKMVFG